MDIVKSIRSFRSILLTLLLLTLAMSGQTNTVKIPLASELYKAQLRGVSGTPTAGTTAQGVYNSTDKLFHFPIPVLGRYKLYIDVTGAGSSYILDAVWSTPDGRSLNDAQSIDALSSFSQHLVAGQVGNDGIQNSAISANKVDITTFNNNQFRYDDNLIPFWEIKPGGLTADLLDNSILNNWLPGDGVTIDTAGGNYHLLDESLRWHHVHLTEFFRGNYFELQSPLGFFGWGIKEHAITDREIAPASAVKRINNLQDTVIVFGNDGIVSSVSNDTLHLSLQNGQIPGAKLASGSVSYTKFDTETQNVLFREPARHEFTTPKLTPKSGTGVNAALGQSSTHGLSPVSVESFTFADNVFTGVHVRFIAESYALNNECFVELNWFSTDNGGGDVVWQARFRSLDDGKYLGETFTTFSATDSYPIGGYEIQRTRINVNTGGNFIKSPGEHVELWIVRDGGSASNSLNASVDLISAAVEYQVNTEEF